MATDKKRKAYNIDFGVPPAASVASDVDGHSKKKSETAPGMMVDFVLTRDATMIENTALKAEVAEIKVKVAEFDGANVTRKIDPKLIRRSHWANRDEAGLTDDNGNFKTLKSEISSARGNVQPIKVRPIPGTFPQEYEIVFGHRRHRACLDLGLSVLATIEPLDDKALFIEMDRENRQRADLRPYEQGLMYKRALDQGLFDSMRKMADALGIEVGTASKATSLANLPTWILGAFQSPLDIQFRWASELNEMLKRFPDVAHARVNEIGAKRAAGESISSHEAFNLLVGNEVKPLPLKPKVVNIGSRALSISERNNKVSFELDKLPKDKLARIEKFIVEVMAE